MPQLFLYFMMQNIRACMQLFRKRAKKGKYLKIWAKMYKFEDILKKCSLMCATITSMKQLEHALNSESASSQE